MAIQLGSRVKDKISGFSGIAIGRTQWQWGCDRILIKPETLHEGKTIEAEWFDEPQVELVEEAKPDMIPKIADKPGGPQKDPKQW